jgi:hypothetical protein
VLAIWASATGAIPKAHVFPSSAPIFEAGLLGVRPLAAEEVIRTGAARTYEKTPDQVWEASLQLIRESGVPLYLDPARRTMAFLKQEYIPEYKSEMSTVPAIYAYTILIEPLEAAGTRVHLARGCVVPASDAAGSERRKPNPYREMAMGSGDREDASYFATRRPSYTDSLVVFAKMREEGFRNALLDRLGVQVLSAERWPWLRGKQP